MKNWRLLVKLSVYVTVRFVAWKVGSKVITELLFKLNDRAFLPLKFARRKLVLIVGERCGAL